MRRRPLTSTLFPYTTLFRSLFEGTGVGDESLAGGLVAVVGAGDVLGDLGDRKSTRLNSSHVKISYAVFCLKKKSRNGGARHTAIIQIDVLGHWDGTDGRKEL